MERTLAVPNRQDDDRLEEEDHRLPERDHREEGKVGIVFLRIRIRHHVLRDRDGYHRVKGKSNRNLSLGFGPKLRTTCMF